MEAARAAEIRSATASINDARIRDLQGGSDSTLEVTPDEAEKLDLARSVGTLSLVLRNQIDPNSGETDGATKASLLKDEVVAAAPPAKPVEAPAARRVVVVRRVAAPAPAAPPPPPAPRNCVEVIRGTVKTNECF